MKVFTESDLFFDEVIQAANRAGSLEPIHISTYTMYLGISKGKDHTEYYPAKARDLINITKDRKNFRLLTGIPYKMKELENLPEYIEVYNTGIQRINDTINMLDLTNIRINPEVHLKYYRVGDRIWVGGMNLSSSSWLDTMVEVTGWEEKKMLVDTFEVFWNSQAIVANADEFKIPLPEPKEPSPASGLI